MGGSRGFKSIDGPFGPWVFNMVTSRIKHTYVRSISAWFRRWLSETLEAVKKGRGRKRWRWRGGRSSNVKRWKGADGSKLLEVVRWGQIRSESEGVGVGFEPFREPCRREAVGSLFPLSVKRLQGYYSWIIASAPYTATASKAWQEEGSTFVWVQP